MHKTIKHPPRIFHVNWFRKNGTGEFLWPGFGENMRVLKWIVDRCHARTDAEETALGWVPGPGSLDLAGLTNFAPERLERVQAIHEEEWRREIIMQDELFMKLHARLPKELIFQRELLLARLCSKKIPARPKRAGTNQDERQELLACERHRLRAHEHRLLGRSLFGCRFLFAATAAALGSIGSIGCSFFSLHRGLDLAGAAARLVFSRVLVLGIARLHRDCKRQDYCGKDDSFHSFNTQDAKPPVLPQVPARGGCRAADLHAHSRTAGHTSPSSSRPRNGSREALFVEADGEVLGSLPVRLEVVPHSLTLACPARRATVTGIPPKQNTSYHRHVPGFRFGAEGILSRFSTYRFPGYRDSSQKRLRHFRLAVPTQRRKKICPWPALAAGTPSSMPNVGFM